MSNVLAMEGTERNIDMEGRNYSIIVKLFIVICVSNSFLFLPPLCLCYIKILIGLC